MVAPNRVRCHIVLQTGMVVVVVAAAHMRAVYNCPVPAVITTSAVSVGQKPRAMSRDSYRRLFIPPDRVYQTVAPDIVRTHTPSFKLVWWRWWWWWQLQLGVEEMDVVVAVVTQVGATYTCTIPAARNPPAGNVGQKIRAIYRDSYVTFSTNSGARIDYGVTHLTPNWEGGWCK